MAESTQSSINSTERLEAVLYQYVSLYERWSEDRQMFSQKAQQLSDAIEILKQEVDDLEKKGGRIKEVLSEQLKSTMDMVQEEVLKSVMGSAKNELREAREEVSRLTSKLKNVANIAQNELQRLAYINAKDDRKKNFHNLLVCIGVAILSGTLGGLVSLWIS